MTSDTLLLGTHKGLLMLDVSGARPALTCEAFAGIPVSHAMLDPRHNTMWACLDHGHWGQKLHRSRDFGQTWEEIPAPKYPLGEEISEGVPATVSYLWLVAPGGADQPDRLYIGTEPGGLFQSDDGGQTFELVQGLWNHPTRKDYWFGGGRDYAGLCSIIVDPRDSQHIIIGISVGGVYESTDGGKSWEPRNEGCTADFLPNPTAVAGQDPHFVVSSPKHPDVLWQQNHCGVFRSTNGGRRWENVSQPGGPVNFGFAIAVDDDAPDTAWVIPAVADECRIAVGGALCVSRTDDGGKTWTAFRDGLPQEQCYDLVFRHALDKQGDRLAFGTTTGNVYLSDDCGESWRCLGSNFPPVSSVRFLPRQ
jgi:photosystem II stability/assembly factor-like uncharacterized protein